MAYTYGHLTRLHHQYNLVSFFAKAIKDTVGVT